MEIIRSEKYIFSLQAIITYISKDSKTRAFSFKSELDKTVNNLLHMPYKFRKSIYFEDENIRDLIFKGYTIVYKVDEAKSTITVVGIK
ncbi:MAG: type II toxin-antitoxin system RelE/ParE family toxin [Sulfurimonas sp.]|nr:type II toxin-antitoxin system RelE/ParE family toxin [Sulfurimonas sp.]PHQ89140.1 MAG: plasmid stabilization protein [Sulfurimonas sp.]